MTKTITTKMLRLLVRQHGLQQIVYTLGEMAQDAAQLEDKQRSRRPSTFYQHAQTLYDAAHKLPDCPFWEKT